MKMTTDKYDEVVTKHRQALLKRDGCLDNAADEATDMLMRIPGLGKYITGRLHEVDSVWHLTRDLVGGFNGR
jgi:hypothetical protein